MYTRKLKKGDLVTEYYGYEFNTFTFRSFNWIHEMFYHKGKKVIKPLIENYMTPLCLAIWISDDGCWAKPGVRIATNCFSYSETELLVKILKNKFNLDCTIQLLKTSNNYSIYIKSSSIPTLRKILLPHTHSSNHVVMGARLLVLKLFYSRLFNLIYYINFTNQLYIAHIYGSRKFNSLLLLDFEFPSGFSKNNLILFFGDASENS